MKSSKEEIYRDVLNAAIELEIKLGHLKWTYSLLSRKSKISRPLIYYYFGKSKLNILKEACHLFGKELAGMSKERMDNWSTGDISKGLLRTRELLGLYPQIIPFYFLYRAQNNEIGELIRDYESQGIKKRKAFFPHLKTEEAKLFQALHLGLCMAPDLRTKEVKAASKLIVDLVQKL